jgi:hypothetical protein
MNNQRTTKTINIGIALHQQLKVVAAQEAKTVQQLVEEVLVASLGLEDE